MKNHEIKNNIRNQKLTFGSWITIGHSSIPEIMSRAGFDWLVIDLEHSVITIEQAQQLIQTIESKGMVPLVRLTENDSALIKRVMDAGAYGVLVPMVKTRKDAKKAINAVKYPPVGTRGVGLARAQGYGKTFTEYNKWVNKESVVIVQIEHIDAVENIDEILSLDDIDGYIIGPYDLSASLGIPGDLNNEKVIEAEQKVLQVAEKYGKIAGFHVVEPDIDLTLQKIKMGYRFIAESIDFLFLGNHCIETMNTIKSKLLEKEQVI
jgi:2-dehydro-3-deoxyglucarate aldolase